MHSVNNREGRGEMSFRAPRNALADLAPATPRRQQRHNDPAPLSTTTMPAPPPPRPAVLTTSTSANGNGLAKGVPEVDYVATRQNRQIVGQVPLLTKPYRPPLWGHSGHLQTLVFGIVGRLSLPPLSPERLVFNTVDRSQVSLDIFSPSGSSPVDVTPIVFVIPGICNSSESGYVRAFASTVMEAGYRAAVFNHHGTVLDLPIAAPRLFTFGGIEDVEVAFHYIMARFPSAPLILVGFSMGANLAIRLAALDEEIQARLTCVLSICQGYDILRANRTFRANPLYDRGMTMGMLKIVKRHEAYLKKARPDLDLDRVYKCKLMCEFDCAFTLPTNPQIPGLEEYYREHSCAHLLNNLKIPTLFVNASDDPMVGRELLDVVQLAARRQPNVIFIRTRHGGHLGFYEGVVMPKTISWMDRLIVSYVQSVLSVA